MPTERLNPYLTPALNSDTGQETGMLAFPSIEQVFPKHDLDRINSLNHTEERRSLIANTEGLEVLAMADQYVRAIYELGIDDPKNAEKAHIAIENALVAFQIRGFQKGQSPTPKQIKSAIKRIALSMENLEQDIGLLMMARRGVDVGDKKRANALEQIHHAILGSIAANILPSLLTSKFTFEDIADTMPQVIQTAKKSGFTNKWSGGFTNVARTAITLHNEYTATELAKPTRVHQVHFTRFINLLGEIYEHWTGQDAHSPDRNSNQPAEWRGPFSRFVEAVWPLTPEGSRSEFGFRNCPTNKQIREALKQSAFLSSTTEL